MMRPIFLAALLVISPTCVMAKSILEELPFGIVIGKTTLQEIEDRGVCRQKSNNQCRVFEMKGFWVNLSDTNIVTAVGFYDIGVSHRLPRKWRELGLSITNPHVFPSDVTRIVQEQGGAVVLTDDAYITRQVQSNLRLGTTYTKRLSGLKNLRPESRG